MNRIAAAALSALLIGPAAAQDTKLAIAPGHAAVLHQYVVTERVQPAVAKMHFELGTAVPDSIKE